MSRRESPDAPSNQQERLPDGVKGQAYLLLSKEPQPAAIASELRISERKVRWMLGMTRKQ